MDELLPAASADAVGPPAAVDLFGPLPEIRAGVIYADPPWAWKSWSNKLCLPTRRKGDNYPLLTVDQMKGLDVASAAADDCVLIMWTISSHLDQALDLMRAWGFAYKSLGPVWVKINARGRPVMSLGKWFRQECEICLLGTRGKPKRRPRPIGTGVRQVVLEPRREHSRKPDIVRARIERLTYGPYLELFARSTGSGWTAWGNEVEKFRPLQMAA